MMHVVASWSVSLTPESFYEDIWPPSLKGSSTFFDAFDSVIPRYWRFLRDSDVWIESFMPARPDSGGCEVWETKMVVGKGKGVGCRTWDDLPDLDQMIGLFLAQKARDIHEQRICR